MLATILGSPPDRLTDLAVLSTKLIETTQEALMNQEAAMPTHPAESPMYAVAYPHHNMPARIPADAVWTLWLTVVNRGSATWLPHPREGYPPLLAAFVDGA